MGNISIPRKAIDFSGTITLGGTAQTIQAEKSNRSYVFICNPAASGGDSLHVSFVGTAVVGSGIPLYPGGSIVMETGTILVNAISIIGPTTTQKFTCYIISDI